MHKFGAVLSLFHVLAVTRAGSYLTLGINDCFERVSIGKRLNSSDVTKTVSTTNLKQCSNECERMLCNAYSYGLSGNGNGTCLLGLDLPKSGPYDDPEYDLFMKILQCRDRTTCFIKVVGGRRLTDKYIQRTLPAESKGDCELLCEYEKEFRCEGFNFRYDMKLDSYSSCQLTSVPTEKLDLSLDFQSDIDYDFFEKNINGSPSCRYLELGSGYGERRQWGVTGNEQDLSLWQDLSPSLYQKNDVGYGNDQVYYDRGIQSTPAGIPGYDSTSLLRPISPYNKAQFPLYSGVNPTISIPDRLPVSINECFIKARTGHHLQRENIVKSMNAPSLYGCETLCANEQTFTCNIFSYRYSFTSSMDNCHFGDKMLRQLDIFQDLVPDRDCDVFVRNELSQPGCQPTRNWDTDCFERIRSGLTIQVSIIKFSVQTENLHECELICLHVKHFTCRVFSFRRGPAVIGKWSDNCYLTDYPVTEMDPNKHFIEDSGCDIYNRGSYGRGCELDKVLPSPGWPTAQPSPGWPTVQPSPGWPTVQPSPGWPTVQPLPGWPTVQTNSGWPSVTGQDLTPTVLTTYRPQYGVPPPLSPSPSPNGPKYGPPTSPPLQFFPITPAPPPQSYFPIGPPSTPIPPSKYYPVTPTTFDTSTKSTGTYVPSLPPTTYFQFPGEYTPISVRPINRESTPGSVFKDFFDPNRYGPNPTQVPTFYGVNKKLCYINFGSPARLMPSAIKKSMTVDSENQCKMECNKAREKQFFRCSTLSYFGGYCELSEIEMRDLKPNLDFNLDQRFLLYTWDFNEVQCYGSPAAKFPPPTNNLPGEIPLEWTWMRFTVNGQPCRSGSYCTQNVNMDIWSCPVEHGDWDYCCRPDHKCGYSEGVSYPWCHVGKAPEQWRPCSDQYFPSTNGPPQTWPVTYIHHTGPPATSATNVPNSSTPSPMPDHRPDDNHNNHGNDTNNIASKDNVVPTVVHHEQSLVDQFLSIFKSSSSDISQSRVLSPEPNNNNTVASLTASHVNRHSVDSLPGFRVVDVTDIPYRSVAAGSINRLYSYGANNNNNRYRNRFTKRKPYLYI